MDETERKDFGEYLKRLRLAQKLSLRQVEKEIGISNSYLYQIERGERNAPKLEILRKLATTYKVTLSALLAMARLSEPEDDDKYFNNIEQSVESAFEMILRDPDYKFGTSVNPDSVPIELKRFAIEMYEQANHLKLLKDKIREDGKEK